MRKGRLIYWGIYILVLTVFSFLVYNKDSIFTKKEEENLSVYCIQELQESFRSRIEKVFSVQVQFVESEEEAQVILKDKITQEESKQYTSIAATPLVIGVSRESKIREEYQKLGYLSEDDNSFAVDNLIEDAIAGNFTNKIYCPQSNTVQGELFYDFLLMTVNHGKYPKNEELKEAKEKVDTFLSLPFVYRVNIEQWLQAKQELKEEICFAYETDIFPYACKEYCRMYYPQITVVYQLYYVDKENRNTSLIDQDTWWSVYSYRRDLRESERYRINGQGVSDLQKEFSYVEIPLQE